MPDRQRLILTAGANSTGYAAQSWRLAKGGPLAFADPAHYLAVTRIAHAGCLDAVFFSDHPALWANPAERPLHSFDPLVLAASLTAKIPDIGVEITASTSFSPPYELARRVLTLDHLSHGRVILNLVSSFNPAIAANYGDAPLPPRDERYRQAHEFAALLKTLFNSWDLCRPADPQRSVWDPSHAQAIDHRGEFFSVRGPLNVPRREDGGPILAQAGGSNAGMELAAAHGEIIYTAQLTLEGARRFGDQIRRRAVSLGRAPDAIRIVPGLVPILGRTRAQALERHHAITNVDGEEALLARFAHEIGIEPSDLDPDAPLSEAVFPSSDDQQRPVGFTQALAELARLERVTARQFVRRVEGGHRVVLGTADEVTADIVHWWESGAVDGFNIQVPVLPDDLTEFVEEVVPRLQDRGLFPRHYDGQSLRRRFNLTSPETTAITRLDRSA
ncbi:FMN-dependent oxidoreductase, nitrilotriacetate monooxygenase family [Arboricoccus pini]|uniref:FMN-dependent oxidoreductase, nitrilotriacetate monooxygenase family n=1 Tax=Arboricoccus pini TaxID=1963835 RepID=A0A212QR04_9PROT|nr:NtaA/DmoA family FMN-dependent monooxygenase [Arboricoccus pini]SNB61982.1 FMN-dependent oxidoreductase, nitrilotriacetate monooxygenase family [Arboricoccus pini]